MDNITIYLLVLLAANVAAFALALARAFLNIHEVDKQTEEMQKRYKTETQDWEYQGLIDDQR